MSKTELKIYDALPAHKGYTIFYLLEYLSVQSGFDLTKHSHIKLKEDIQTYQEEFETIFADTVFDYILTTSLGESRHAYKCCKSNYYLINTYEYGRSEIYSTYAHKYEPQNVIDTLDVLFNKSWSGNFGGKKWRNVVLAAKLYYQNKKVFLDHCADLEHNCGSVFTKYYTLGRDNNTTTLKLLLDSKFHYGDDLPKYLNHSQLNYKIFKLLQRAKNLGIIKYAPLSYDTQHVESTAIRVWRDKKLELQKKTKKPKESANVKKESKKITTIKKPAKKEVSAVLPGWLHTA